MPTSTADTVTNAFLPASAGAFTVTGRSVSGFICCGASTGDIDLALGAIDRDERLADRARRRDLLDRRAAAEHERGHVDVVAFPVLRHRNFEHSAGFCVDVARVKQVIDSTSSTPGPACGGVTVTFSVSPAR